ncbi:MAG: hypothetical protein DRJ42_08500 [Deltaproteobacteria bacterium]|nr:MAG: hypothetical protein DRJ42_08500 [Deltaproteobacteria bacterium]
MRATPRLWAPFFVFLLWPATACEEANTYQPPPPVEVTVATPITGEVMDVIETDGVIAGLEEVEIRAQVQGTITEIHFENGQIVEEGDALFTIDPRPYSAALQQARAELRTVRAAADFARTTLSRAEDLHRTGAMSDQQFDQARQTNVGAIARVAQTQAAVQNAEINLDYTNVVAPIPGRMSRRFVDRGALVGAAGDATRMATVVNSTRVYADFTLSQNEVLTVRTKVRESVEENGLEVSEIEIPVLVALANEEGYPHHGHLDSVENTMNSSTGTLSMRALMPNADATLIPGLFARVQVPLGRSQGILVPEVAVGLDQVGRFVFTVNEENEVERQNVTVGAQHEGTYVRIEEGLAGDEKVVINGMVRIRVGSHVTATEETLEPPDRPFADGAPGPTRRGEDNPSPSVVTDDGAEPEPPGEEPSEAPTADGD